MEFDRVPLTGSSQFRTSAFAFAALLAIQFLIAPVAHSEAAGASAKTSVLKIPKDFKPLNTTAIDGGLKCVAGVTRDEDAMNQRAFVYVEDANKHPLWSTPLKLRDDWYQNRATKCVGVGSDVFVLVESDTDSHQATSQTFLSVVKLSAADGKIENTKNLVIDEATGANSAWVGDKPDGFTVMAGKIVVKGNYFLMSDPDTRLPFSMTLPTSLDK
jgi:hypothetical protein